MSYCLFRKTERNVEYYFNGKRLMLRLSEYKSYSFSLPRYYILVTITGKRSAILPETKSQAEFRILWCSVLLDGN